MTFRWNALQNYNYCCDLLTYKCMSLHLYKCTFCCIYFWHLIACARHVTRRMERATIFNFVNHKTKYAIFSKHICHQTYVHMNMCVQWIWYSVAIIMICHLLYFYLMGISCQVMLVKAQKMSQIIINNNKICKNKIK